MGIVYINICYCILYNLIRYCLSIIIIIKHIIQYTVQWIHYTVCKDAITTNNENQSRMTDYYIILVNKMTLNNNNLQPALYKQPLAIKDNHHDILSTINRTDTGH